MAESSVLWLIISTVASISNILGSEPRLHLRILLIHFDAHLRLSKFLLCFLVLDIDGAFHRLIGQNILHQILNLGVVSGHSGICVRTESQIFIYFFGILRASIV
jgi:hypothetical protein